MSPESDRHAAILNYAALAAESLILEKNDDLEALARLRNEQAQIAQRLAMSPQEIIHEAIRLVIRD